MKKDRSNNISRRSFLEKTGATAAGLALIPGSAALSFSLKSCAEQNPGSFVPGVPSEAPNYFCTFNGQGYYRSERLMQKNAEKYANLDPHRFWATMLNEDTVLGENGFAHTLFPETRDGMFFMLDDGWDIPIVSPNGWYGSVILDIDKFPSFTGTPEERLIKLNKAFKDLGWRGVGLWIACQEAPAIMEAEADKYAKDIDSDEPLYWVERMKWMAEAGIEYWKIDWGEKANDESFREKLTVLAEKYAPGLLIEHAYISAPLNTPLPPEEARKAKEKGLSWIYQDIGEQGRLSPEYKAEYKQYIPISHVFRLYDITMELGISSMIERAAQALALFGPEQPTKCLLNCEIFPYLGAGLGLCIGIMRHPRKDITYHEQVIKGGRETSDNVLADLPEGNDDAARGAPLYLDMKMMEIARTLNWHRIAPPFPVGGHETHLSDLILSDSWELRQRKTWYSSDLNAIMVQKAPAVVCRNIDMVKVTPAGQSTEGPEVPFVIVSRHPNGAVSVATLGRLSLETGYINPDALIEADLKEVKGPVGLFGHFSEVTLKAGNINKKTRVWAQDLLEKESVDITSRVKLEDGSLTIKGELAREICKPVNEDDWSEPGFVVSLMQN
jgi:hypothetical protein